MVEFRWASQLIHRAWSLKRQWLFFFLKLTLLKRPSFLNLDEINDSLHMILVGETCAITSNLKFSCCKQKKYMKWKVLIALVNFEIYTNHNKVITVVKSYLVLPVLGRPKQWERSSRVQRTCSQKTPVITPATVSFSNMKETSHNIWKLKFALRSNTPLLYYLWGFQLFSYFNELLWDLVGW